MSKTRVVAVLALVGALAAVAVLASGAAAKPAEPEATVKLGFITKFPVDFFFVIEDAAKEWNKAHPDVELITGQGAAGDDHEGQIALIESMVAQGSNSGIWRSFIARIITPWSCSLN